MNEWQRGIPIEELRSVAEIFRAHDDGLCFGAFGSINEAKVAEWIAKDRLALGPDCAIAARELLRDETISDFRRRPAARLPARMILIERLAFVGEAGRRAAADLLEVFGSQLGPFACWIFQEHPEDRQLMADRGFRCIAVKISAASEIRGLWASQLIEPAAIPPAELLGLAQLKLPPLDVGPLADALAADLDWQQHYSAYNERGSWQALALRGFGDAAFVEKPSEMSKAWKAAHPALMAAGCCDTSLRDRLPEAEQLIAQIPGPHQRIRLMRVTPGGALRRHADIIDLEAGISRGYVARIHLPIISNEQVRFWSWQASGQRQEAIMRPGEAWYLDTRKPHAAENGGRSDRIHLVIDAHVGPELLELLA